jgi:hypothetical protein
MLPHHPDRIFERKQAVVTVAIAAYRDADLAVLAPVCPENR